MKLRMKKILTGMLCVMMMSSLCSVSVRADQEITDVQEIVNPEGNGTPEEDEIPEETETLEENRIPEANGTPEVTEIFKEPEDVPVPTSLEDELTVSSVADQATVDYENRIVIQPTNGDNQTYGASRMSGNEIVVSVSTANASSEQEEPSRYRLKFTMANGCELESFKKSDGTYEKGEMQLGNVGDAKKTYGQLVFDDDGNPCALDYCMESNGQTTSFTLEFISPNGITPNETADNSGVTITAEVTESAPGTNEIHYRNRDSEELSDALKLCWTSEFNWTDLQKNVTGGLAGDQDEQQYWQLEYVNNAYVLTTDPVYTITAVSQNKDGQGDIFTKEITCTDTLTLPDNFHFLSGQLTISEDGRQILIDGQTVLTLATEGSQRFTGTPAITDGKTLTAQITAVNSDDPDSEISWEDMTVTLSHEAVVTSSGFKPSSGSCGNVTNTVNFVAEPVVDDDNVSLDARAEFPIMPKSDWSASKTQYSGYPTTNDNRLSGGSYVSSGQVICYQLYLRNKGGAAETQTVTDVISEYLDLIAIDPSDSSKEITVTESGDYTMIDGTKVQVAVETDASGKLKKTITFPETTVEPTKEVAFRIKTKVSETVPMEYGQVISNTFHYNEGDSNEITARYDGGCSLKKEVIYGQRYEAPQTVLENPQGDDVVYYDSDLIGWRVTVENTSSASITGKKLIDVFPVGIELAKETDSKDTYFTDGPYTFTDKGTYYATEESNWSKSFQFTDPDNLPTALTLTGTITTEAEEESSVDIPLSLYYDRHASSSGHRKVYVDMSGVTIPAGAVLTVDYYTLARPSQYDEEQTLTNVISYPDGGTGTGTGSRSIKVRGKGMSLTKTFLSGSHVSADGTPKADNSEIEPGDSVSYIVTIRNEGYASQYFAKVSDYMDFYSWFDDSYFSADKTRDMYLTATVSMAEGYPDTPDSTGTELTKRSIVSCCEEGSEGVDTTNRMGVLFNKVTVPAHTEAAQKITVTYTEDVVRFNELVDKCIKNTEGRVAYNNFAAGDMHAKDSGMTFAYKTVDMQKGVAALLNTADGVTFSDVPSKYDFDAGDGNYILYYAVAYNNSDSEITLKKFVDNMPNGVTYAGLAASSADYKSLSNIVDTYTGSDPGFVFGKYKDSVSIPDSSYVNISITGTADGQRVTFSFNTDDGWLKLKPGEGIQFAFYGKVEETNSNSEYRSMTNYIALKTDAQLVYNTLFWSSLNSGYQNNGWPGKLSDGSGYGETEKDPTSYWMHSSVTVQEGFSITPGVTKKVTQYYDETAGKWVDIDNNSRIKPGQQVKWEITVYNEGKSKNSLSNYRLTDLIEYPYYIDTTEACDYTVHFSWDLSGSGRTYPLYMRQVGDTASQPFEFTSYEAVEKDSSGNESTSIDYSIGAGAYATLTVVTRCMNSMYVNGTFRNIIDLYPSQSYDEGTVVHGQPKTQGDEKYIENSAVVYVLGEYGTYSEKTVEESDDPSNKASGNSTINRITVFRAKDGETDKVTYSNIVTNTSAYDFNKFVMIDLLPSEGDTGVVNQYNKRGSEFAVTFDDSVPVTVQIRDKDGNTLNTGYQVSYSKKTTFEDEDWDGTSDWTWSGSHTSARSFRVVITGNDEESNVFPAGATVTITYGGIIADDAEVGETAYNSFGYRYGNSTQTLTAEPQKVGVSIETDPHITKTVLDDNGNPIKDDKTEFTLTFYEGTTADPGKVVTGTWYDEVNKQWKNLENGSLTVSAARKASLDTKTKVNGVLNGYLQEGKTYTVVETIPGEDTGSGIYEAQSIGYGAYYYNSGNTLTFVYEGGSTDLEVTNIYHKVSVKPEVTKKVTGTGKSSQPDEKFVFTLADANPEGTTGYTMPETEEKTVSIKADETGVFGNLSFSKTGTYYFTITETKGSTPGMTYDTDPRYVRVAVTSSSGKYSAAVYYGKEKSEEGTPDTSLTVENSVEKPVSTAVILTALKRIEDSDGKEVGADVYKAAKANFTFCLEDANEKGTTGYTMTDPMKVQYDDTDEHVATFGGIKFTEAGTYTFTVNETGKTYTGDNYLIDVSEEVLTATVDVTVDKENKLQAETTWAGDDMTITNLYRKAESTSAQLSIRKKLEADGGSTPDLRSMAGRFSFVLKAKDGAPLPAKTTATNAADGSVTFDRITYDMPGTYRYTITETDGKLSNWEYDTEPVEVTVVIGKKITLKGMKLAVKSISYSKSGTITNRYIPDNPPGDTPPGDHWETTSKKEVRGEVREEPVPEQEVLGVVRTGDSSNVGALAAVAVAALCAAVGIAVFRRKSRK